MLFPWGNSMGDHLPGRRNRVAHKTTVRRNRPRRRRLALEQLESRRLLATFTVAMTADIVDGVCGDDTAGGGCSLREAVMAANAAPGTDTIALPPGTYTLEATGRGEDASATGDLDLSEDVVIVGLGTQPGDTVIDANGIDRAIDILSGPPGNTRTIQLRNLSIMGGEAVDENGGAIRNAAIVELEDVIISGSRASGASVAGFGGALSNNGPQATLRNSLLTGNSSAAGGAIHAGSGVITLVDTQVTNNTSSASGGAIYAHLDLMTPTIIAQRTTFSDNTAAAAGGAIRVEDAVLRLEDTTLLQNVAGQAGGGLSAVNSQIEFIRGRFESNTALMHGGGAALLDSGGTIAGTWFFTNQVTGSGTEFRDGGGAIALLGGALEPAVTADGIVVQNNSAPTAGGIAIDQSRLMLNSSVVQGNSATNSLAGAGGGLGVYGLLTSPPQPALQIADSTIVGNSAQDAAGGIAVEEAIVVIVMSTVDGNTAGAEGGGIGVKSGDATARLEVQQSTISNNTSGGDGGGIGAVDALLSLTNVTLSDNVTGAEGGGLALVGSSANAVIDHATIASNHSTTTGAGDNLFASGPVTISNTIVADPASGTNQNCVGAAFVTSLGHNLDSGTSCGFTATSDLSSTDPLLGPLADNGGSVFTRLPTAGSPAIDAAPMSTQSLDTRGAIRPQDGNGDSLAVADIGAHEVDAVAMSASVEGVITCDANGNGQVDPGEGVAGVSVFLDLNGNALQDADETATLTDTAGFYAFSGVAPGSVTVIAAIPGGCIPAPAQIDFARSAFPVGRLTRDLSTVDYDGDGHTDVVAVNEYSADVVVLRGDGSGALALDRTLALRARPVAMDSGGDQEGPLVAIAAVGGQGDPGSLFVLRGDVIEAFPVGNGPIDVSVEDFDGDGLADFVLPSIRDGQLNLLLGSVGKAETVAIAMTRNPRSVTTGDVNGDGDQDIVLVSSGFAGDSEGELLVLLGDGTGAFPERVSLAVPPAAVAVSLAEVRSSGQLDIVVARQTGAIDLFRVVAGPSTVIEALSSTETVAGLTNIDTGDIDGDGRADVVATSLDGEVIQLLLGDGTGSFTAARPVEGVPSPVAVHVADLQGGAVPLPAVLVANFYGASNPFELPSTLTALTLERAASDVLVVSSTVSQIDFQLRPIEQPQLTSADGEPAALPLDVNADSVVTPLDSLILINALNRTAGAGEGEVANRRRTKSTQLDVNDDGRLTSLDALLVINYLNRRMAEPSGEDKPDDLLPMLTSDPQRRRGEAVDLALEELVGGL